MSGFEIMQKDYMQALKYFVGKEEFDLIFLDPPYNSDMGEKSIEYIIKNNILKDDGLIIFEHSAEKCLQTDGDSFIITKSKKYGDKVIDFVTAR